MVRFSRIHQFPGFLETFPVNFGTIIAAGSKFSKVLVELEASIISESINFHQKTSSGMNRSVWRVVQYSQIDSIGVSRDKKGLHWYQWYDRYQWKSTLFQWFYW